MRSENATMAKSPGAKFAPQARTQTKTTLTTKLSSSYLKHSAHARSEQVLREQIREADFSLWAEALVHSSP